MFIKEIIIEGFEDDVIIRHTEAGAIIIANDVAIEVNRQDSRDDRFAVAYNAAKVICGANKHGVPNATNSMIHDVLREIERVADC